jgi:purine-binding chemotaxis protein CheW
MGCRLDVQHRQVSSSPVVSRPEQRADAAGLLLFRLDAQRCAIPAAAVVEILSAVATSPLPRQPSYVAGVIDVRGSVMPVLDLRVRFGHAGRPLELADQFIVVRAGARLFALWVDQVEGFAASDAVAFSPAAGLIVQDRSLAGVTSVADGLANIYDLDAFVAECEADAVFETSAA